MPSSTLANVHMARSWQSSIIRRWSAEPAIPRVLVVDDDASLLALLGAIFRSAGFLVTTASNAYLALDAVRAGEPQVIILDLEMPGMDGREFYRKLRTDSYQTPVLILSAYNARAAQLELGAQAYTAKPFEPDQLVEAVRSLIEASGNA